jgi:hypothetical protein
MAKKLDGLVIPKAKVAALGGPVVFAKLIGDLSPPITMPETHHQTHAGVVPVEDGDWLVRPREIERLGGGDMERGLAKLRGLLK